MRLGSDWRHLTMLVYPVTDECVAAIREAQATANEGAGRNSAECHKSDPRAEAALGIASHVLNIISCGLSAGSDFIPFRHDDIQVRGAADHLRVEATPDQRKAVGGRVSTCFRI